MVLPKEHPDLRAFVTQRECFDISEEECLNQETEKALAILISSEIKMLEELRDSKQEIEALHLSDQQIFNLLDTKNEGLLNYNSLKNFIQETGVLPFDSELIAFLRRVDKDDDGAISLKEFENFMVLFSNVGKIRKIEERMPKDFTVKDKTPSRNLRVVPNIVSLIPNKAYSRDKASTNT